MKLAVTGNCELQFAFNPLADDLSNTKAKDFCKEIFLLLRKQSWLLAKTFFFVLKLFREKNTILHLH